MKIISPDKHRINENGEYDFSQESSDRAYKLALEEWHELCYHKIGPDIRGRVLLAVGLPGSGKSTLLENPASGGYFWEQELRDAFAVFDATLTSRLARRPLIEIARMSRKARVEALVFDVPLCVALQRNSERPNGRRVPYGTMMRMAQQLEDEPPSVAEGLWRITATSRE